MNEISLPSFGPEVNFVLKMFGLFVVDLVSFFFLLLSLQYVTHVALTLTL